MHSEIGYHIYFMFISQLILGISPYFVPKPRDKCKPFFFIIKIHFNLKRSNENGLGLEAVTL